MHALRIGAILAHIDFLDEQIASLTEAIAEQIAPFEKAVEPLCAITGFNGTLLRRSSPGSAWT